jgi:hypothetical protein
MKASAVAARAGQRGVVLACVLGASACAAQAPPPAPPPPVTRAPAPPLVDVNALQARFVAAGFNMVLTLDDAGRITGVRTAGKSVDGSVAKDMTSVAHALAWLGTYGDAFGYGRLGAATPETTEAQPVGEGAERVLVWFPNAERCPDLVVAATFLVNADRRMLFFTELFCPSLEDGPERLARLREGMSEQPPPAPPAFLPSDPASNLAAEEPAPAWLRSQGYVLTSVIRARGTMTVKLAKKIETGDARRALAMRLAKGVAKAAGLPELDAIRENTFNPTTRDPKPGLRSLALEQSAPPLDGRCIEPGVVVALGEPFDKKPVGGYWVEEIYITCEHERVTGRMPRADHARTLPVTAKGAVPYLAACTSVSFSSGESNHGWVLDNHGDVFTFSGGRSFQGKSMHELAVLARHERTYVGTLPPADVDRLWALGAQLPREPLVKTPIRAADGGAGGCVLLRGGLGGALGRLTIDSYSNDHRARRTGPVSTELARLMGRAETLVRRGN